MTAPTQPSSLAFVTFSANVKSPRWITAIFPVQSMASKSDVVPRPAFTAAASSPAVAVVPEYMSGMASRSRLEALVMNNFPRVSGPGGTVETMPTPGAATSTQLP